MNLSELTTLRVGGPADRVIAPATRDELIDAVREAWATGDPWLVLGGGSNVLIGDGDFEGTVVRVVTRGIDQLVLDETSGEASDTVIIRVQAGENWDDLVALTVSRGWAGIEALSGIPGNSGAAPIQNIGAYGQELDTTLVAIDFLDYLTGDIERIPASDLALGYRTSVLKQGHEGGREGVVLSIELRLRADAAGLSDPIRFPQLASALGVELGAQVPLASLRESVLALRSSKGMVLNADDPDSVSAGSFFTNPIVSESFARGLPENAPRWAMEPEPQAVVVPLDAPVADYNDSAISALVAAVGSRGSGSGDGRPQVPQVKLSAAWLIEHSGIRRGFSLPGSRAAVSSKHTLALINTGGARADDISELARYIQTRVMSEFGVRLHPEPVQVGIQI